MDEHGPASSACPELADSLESCTPVMLQQYADLINESVSVISRDPEALAQALDNAEQILGDVKASLRAGRIQVDERYKLLAWDIGVSRAVGGVHPRESLQASSMLFTVVLSTATRQLGSNDDALAVISLITMVLERSIGLRVRESMAGYTAQLLNRVQEAQLDERRRIARELHDRIGAGMSVSHRQLELYHLYLPDQPAKATAKVATAQQAILESMRHLRAVTSDLYAQERVEGLEKALLQFVESVDSDEVSIRLRVNGDENWAAPEVLDEAFLIVREAGRNALLHGAPSMLLIAVDITPYELRATIEDDGCGFDQTRPGRGSGVGLNSMRERAQLLGGAVAVASEQGRGTLVDVVIPLAGRFDGRSDGRAVVRA